jgi:hypothetical protein
MTTPTSGASEMPSQSIPFDLASLGLTSLLSSQIRDRIAAAEATKNQVLDFEQLPAPPASIPSGETISREDALSPILLELSDIDAVESGLGSDFLPITDPASGAGALDLLLGGGEDSLAGGQAGDESNVSFLLGNGLSTYTPSDSLEDFALIVDFASSFTSSGSLDPDVSAEQLFSAVGLTGMDGSLLNGLNGLCQ